jgi:cbb3-type cytochrome oxidase maturation protein
MEVMIILVGFSIMVAAGFLGAFFWALRNGQFDDLFTPAIRILFESKRRKKRETSESGEPVHGSGDV